MPYVQQGTNFGIIRQMPKEKRRNGIIYDDSDDGLVADGKTPIHHTNRMPEVFERPHIVVTLITYFSLTLFVVFGLFQNLLRRFGFRSHLGFKEFHREGYVSLYDRRALFFSEQMYRKASDCFNKPICSVPGAKVTLLNRVSKNFGWTYEHTGRRSECINLGSYNYLGFAQNEGVCADESEQSTLQYGLGLCSNRHELGSLEIHLELEQLMAEFLGVEDCLVNGMGFATNSMNIPALIGPGCLILSDELNHASLVLGCRLSGACIRVYKHNDMKDLENCLREAIIAGWPKKRRSWKKIIIVCEGCYSMEGSVVDLPQMIALKKKYKAYLYLDEAHSIGAMGPRGRGIVDFFNCDPNDVDILMGTFTKSFGAAGGYIAGNKRLIDHLRTNSHCSCYATSMSAPVARQIITVTKIIMGKDGSKDGLERIKTLHRNTRYFRYQLHKMGFIVWGNNNSPIVPLLIYLTPKATFFSRYLEERGIATVVVGFPATTMTTIRARLCLSAKHTREMLDQVLAELDKVGDLLSLKYSRMPFSAKFQLEEGEREDFDNGASTDSS